MEFSSGIALAQIVFEVGSMAVGRKTIHLQVTRRLISPGGGANIMKISYFGCFRAFMKNFNSWR